MSGLPFGRIGEGPRVVCVHGSGQSGARWLPLTMLVSGFEFILVDRPNHGTFAASGPSTFDAEADGVAALLGDGAHLLGHSYGAIVAMLAAARQPDRVLSLTVIEPPALHLAAGNGDADALVSRFSDGVYPVPEGIAEEEWWSRWLIAMGGSPSPEPMSDEQRAATRAMMWEQPIWGDTIPLEVLANAGFPILAISGGWHPAFDAVIDAIVRATGARQLVRPNAGHDIGDFDAWVPAVRALWLSV